MKVFIIVACRENDDVLDSDGNTGATNRWVVGARLSRESALERARSIEENYRRDGDSVTCDVEEHDATN